MTSDSQPPAEVQKMWVWQYHNADSRETINFFYEKAAARPIHSPMEKEPPTPAPEI